MRKHYQRVGGFTTGDMGMLGLMSHDGAEFFFQPTRPHGAASEFDLRGIESLPDVDLLFSHPGGSGPRHDQKLAGIVIANTGFNCEESLAYLKLARAGTIVVSAFPTGDNVARNWPPEDRVPSHVIEPCAHIDPSQWEGRWIPPINAEHLTPQKGADPAHAGAHAQPRRPRDPAHLQALLIGDGTAKLLSRPVNSA